MNQYLEFDLMMDDKYDLEPETEAWLAQFNKVVPLWATQGIKEAIEKSLEDQR